jgi:SAM-dependent methyltransferase
MISGHPAFGGPWYYEMELAPGLFSAGREQRSVAQTRELLRRTDVTGARCLDLGMQEGLVTTLLARRGGAEVVGYDRVLRSGRLALVQSALGVEFDLVGGMKLQDLPAAVQGAFDVVVFSGVLYHMLDPIAGLATVRGLVRDGGICLVETMVSSERSDSMFFNVKGNVSKWSLWLITPQLLDYILRFLRFEPLDVVYLGPPGRVAIACRAIPETVAEPDDDWIGSEYYERDMAEYLDWDRVASDLPEVAYDDSRAGLVRRGPGPAIDVAASIDATGPLEVEPSQARLEFGATD